MRADEADDVVAFIARHQSDPSTAVATVGMEVEGIRAELGELDPPWIGTVRIVGEIDGVALVDWDPEVRRAWVHGPWVDGGDEVALALFDAVAALVPAEIDEVEVSGDVANELVARVAAARDLHRGVVNHALIVDRGTADGWGVDAVEIRPGTAADLDAIAPLHHAEFPATYLRPAQLVAEGRVLLVAPGAGYATGEVHADGEGFIDFVAVDEAARGKGVGRALVAALTRELFTTATRVALTVQDHRGAARALYASMGFTPDASLVGYRGPLERS